MDIITIIGQVFGIIAVALGFMRSNQPVTALSMALGKLVRYSALFLAFKGVISL